MPYTLDWPQPVIPQDAQISFDVDAKGSVIVGAVVGVYLKNA